MLNLPGGLIKSLPILPHTYIHIGHSMIQSSSYSKILTVRKIKIFITVKCFIME